MFAESRPRTVTRRSPGYVPGTALQHSRPFDFASDPHEGLERLHWVVPRRGLAREHEGVGAV